MKTLLLVFIHGFKGDDNTFGAFPQYLGALLSDALPKIAVVALKYPAFETRGLLNECVARFREWLQNKVIDIEVDNGTPSPTVDPSVHVVLVGHSMGGIVAVDSLISIVSEEPISPSPAEVMETTTVAGNCHSMFPYVHGVLAMDTPLLGIAPGVVAHSAESQWTAASTAYSAYTNVTSALGIGVASNAAAEGAAVGAGTSTVAAAAAAAAGGGGGAGNRWQQWSRVAAYAGAAGVVAAGGAAAYRNRQMLTEGMTWAGSHLEFVGCLTRNDELRKRMATLSTLMADGTGGAGVGFANIYAVLGEASRGRSEWTSSVLGERRTFVALPQARSAQARHWTAVENPKASTEVWAHMGMFNPTENESYYKMAEMAKQAITGWVEGSAWYMGDGTVESTTSTDMTTAGPSLSQVRLLVDADAEADAMASASDSADTGAVVQAKGSPNEWSNE